MWRLIEPRPAEGERGAVAVMFALLLVGLVGFIALSVDIGATYAKRQELQNGADAAALAAAQECATVGCGGAEDQANEFTKANVRTQKDTVKVEEITYPASNVVKVYVEGDQRHWFLPVIPLAPDSSRVGATAAATWVAPTQGTSKLPLTFSMCDFEAMEGPSGKIATIYLTKSKEGCEWGVEGLAMPGGFGMIGDGGCAVDINIAEPWVEADEGANLPCSKDEMQAMLGQVVLIPIFDKCRRGNSDDEYCPEAPQPGDDDLTFELGASDRYYHIYSFAAFRIDSYNFNGNSSPSAPCKGKDNCIRGQFIEWVTLEDSGDYEGEVPDLGATVVKLIDPRDVP